MLAATGIVICKVTTLTKFFDSEGHCTGTLVIFLDGSDLWL